MNSRHDLVAAKSPDPIVVTRALIKRAWSDFEPKLVAGLMSGTVASGLITLLNAYGITLPVPVVSGLPVGCFMLAGWITSSVGTVTTIRTGDGLVVEKHSGSVEVRTGAIPIPGYVPRGTSAPSPKPAAPPVQTPEPPADPEPYEVPDRNESQNFTQVLQPAEEPAAVPSWMSTSRGGSILSHLPSSGGNPVAYHDNAEDGH